MTTSKPPYCCTITVSVGLSLAMWLVIALAVRLVLA